MMIEQLTNKPNHYEIYYYITDAQPIAEFDIVENRITGNTEVVWAYGEDFIPLDTLSEVNSILYQEV